MIEVVHCAAADTALILGALTFATGMPLVLKRWISRFPSANSLVRVLHVGFGVAASFWGLLAYLSGGIG